MRGYFACKSNRIYTRILSSQFLSSTKSILLLGPRQVGKSTLIKSLKPDLIIDLVPRQTVIRHFEILEDTLIARKVINDPDLDEDLVDLVKHPRFYFFDVGVTNALRGSFDVSGDRIGALWEYVVFNQISNSCQSYDIDYDIYNFRTRGGLEVDFILKLNSQKFAIECKSDIYIDKFDLRNIINLHKYYEKIERIVIYRGKHEKKIEGIWVLPLPSALKKLGLS